MGRLAADPGKGRLAAVDPGKHGCGAALFVDGRLAAARYVSGEGPRQIALAVWGWLVSSAGLELVVEVPQVYVLSRRGSKDPNDLIDVALVAGAVMALAPGKVQRRRPADWKGQVPKEVMTRRIRNDWMAPEEHLAVTTTTASLMHNVYDAVGIGIYELRQRGLRPAHVSG